MKRKTILPSILAALTLANCSNNGLAEKFKDPGASSSSSSSSTMYIFVHSFSTVGDMSGLANGGCGGNGQTRADCSCQDRAVAANLMKPGISKYIAWLSTAANDMRCRIRGMTGIDCAVLSGGPIWNNSVNERVASGYSALIGGSLFGAVQRTELGNFGAGDTWTGTLSDGKSDNGNNCGDFTSTAGNGRRGQIAATNASWTQAGTSACTGSAPIYCIGIP